MVYEVNEKFKSYCVYSCWESSHAIKGSWLELLTVKKGSNCYSLEEVLADGQI